MAQSFSPDLTKQFGSWQHGYAHTNGIQLHYVTQGTGDLVLMLHGFPEFWYSWRHQISP
ncbi:MAG: alpha/beta fold hydrolase, partial [Cyanophyceae cyanobacterium]